MGEFRISSLSFPLSSLWREDSFLPTLTSTIFSWLHLPCSITGPTIHEYKGKKKWCREGGLSRSCTCIAFILDRVAVLLLKTNAWYSGVLLDPELLLFWNLRFHMWQIVPLVIFSWFFSHIVSGGKEFGYNNSFSSYCQTGFAHVLYMELLLKVVQKFQLVKIQQQESFWGSFPTGLVETIHLKKPSLKVLWL